MSLETFDDFEDGDVSEWNTNNFNIKSNKSYNGTYSGGAEKNNLNDRFLASRSFGQKVEKVEYYWYEQSTSFGGATEFYRNGNRICGVGTTNPQWIYTDVDSSSTFYSGDGYGRWVKTTVDFTSYDDYTVTMKDLQSGTQKSITASKEYTGLPEDVRIVTASATQRLGNQTVNSRGDEIDMWWDEFSISPISLLKAPTNVSASVSSNDVSLSWDTASGASGYNILRAPSSGGSFSQIDSVGSGTTSFTDTGLQFNEDYAYKIESFN